jgi:hypothetical protein
VGPRSGFRAAERNDVVECAGFRDVSLSVGDERVASNTRK